MSRRSTDVHDAVDRWLEKGLVDEGLAARLRDEVDHADESDRRRQAQYLIAAAGAVVLVIAGGLFVDWTWPRMGIPSRSAMLGVAGVAVSALGTVLEDRRRWLPAAYLMQVAGLALMLTAALYSGRAWRDQTPASVAVGVACLLVPIVLAPRSLGRSVVMPAVHLAFGLAFLALFLDRATSLSPESIIWVVDAALLAAMAGLIRLVVRDPLGERHAWALPAFVTGHLAGMVMILLTGFLSLDLDNDTVWPLTAWLAVLVGLTHWGLVRTPEGTRRHALDRVLLIAILLWVPIAFTIAYETLDAPAELALFLVAGGGVAGFVYGERQRLGELLVGSVVAFIVGVWVWGVDRAGALGAVAALAATAGVLFWVSGKRGRSDAEAA